MMYKVFVSLQSWTVLRCLLTLLLRLSTLIPWQITPYPQCRVIASSADCAVMSLFPQLDTLMPTF